MSHKNHLSRKQSMANDLCSVDSTVIASVITAIVGVSWWFIRKIFIIDREYVSREELENHLDIIIRRIENNHSESDRKHTEANKNLQNRVDKIYRYLATGKADD